MTNKNAQNSVLPTLTSRSVANGRELAQQFRGRLAGSLANSKMTSWRQVAKASGCSPSLLHSIARGDYDNSDKGPGIFGTFRAAKALDVSLDDLLPPKKRPTVGRFLANYQGLNTPIQSFSNVLEFCDVYGEPRKGLTHIIRLGPRSLLSERSSIHDPALLQLEYERWPAARRRRIFERQKRAWMAGALTELEFFDVRFEESETEVRVSFILSACRVLDFDGEQRLLVFCEPLAQ